MPWTWIRIALGFDWDLDLPKVAQPPPAAAAVTAAAATEVAAACSCLLLLCHLLMDFVV